MKSPFDSRCSLQLCFSFVKSSEEVGSATSFCLVVVRMLKAWLAYSA
jgi:hypothetical protein